MKHLKKNTQQGIIGSLVLIVAAIILIAYFRANIKGFFSSPQVKDAILTAITWIQQGLLWIVNKLGWTSTQIK
ncbi:TPA: hypothetical protein DCQ44_01345 [Candidatus Taylorbacteria bacterium]|nr:hypothetical protein [Candidatus Taylorbacteria bacterium]